MLPLDYNKPSAGIPIFYVLQVLFVIFSVYISGDRLVDDTNLMKQMFLTRATQKTQLLEHYFCQGNLFPVTAA